ncbi:jerky protein homolog-like [Neodiprion virginianus]|uniref:jerky protein homolog-like n=1 Tax=Neodiprion virginianus TaxID=2961670 RepID=UPI001EE69F79|nr:jerky protein homolog-like [Neodiprion virginianus]
MAPGSTNSNSDREDNVTGGEGGDDLNKLRLERQQLANQQKELDKSLRDKQQQDTMMAEIRRLTEENEIQRQLVERLSAVEPIQQSQNIEGRVEAGLAQLDLTYEEREREKPQNSQSYNNNSYNTSEINKPGHINAQPKYQQISQHNGVSTNPNFQNTVPTAIHGEALSVDSSAAENFKTSFKTILNEGFSREDVYNADETGINWISLPRKSLASQEETAARGFKVSKDRVTAMTCANAAGTHKLPLLIIGKPMKPRCFKNIVTLPVTYNAQKSAWMDAKLFCDWYVNDFIKGVRKWRQANDKTGGVLLLLDNAPYHPSAEVLNALDSDFVVKFFPPNVTSLIQPTDQGVIEKLKRLYRKQILRRLLHEDDITEECGISFSKSLNLKHACYMLADSWESLTEDNLSNTWKKVWPLSEDPRREGEEGNSGSNENEHSDFVALFEKWLKGDVNDPGYQILEDDEIVSSLINTNEEDNNDHSSSGEPAGSSTKISHAEAFSAFETDLEWYEKQEECCPM